jgi:subtilisin family serine protease
MRWLMTSVRSAFKTAIAASIVFSLYGCADEPTAPQPDIPQSRSVASSFGLLQDVPAVTMDLPPSPRPWDTDDAALVAALAAEDGQAIVAFNLPTSARASDASGRRAALPAAGFAQSLELLESSGAEILHVYRSFGAASVRIDPALGPELRRNSLVDYIEPRQWSQLAGAPVGTNALAAMLAAASTQVTPWGITMVRAPEAWSLSTGSGVKVLIIDTGVNSHEDLPAIPGSNCGGGFGGCDDGPIYHGTHVAGSFLGQNNTVGVVGVAPGIAGNLVYAWGACNSTTGSCSNPEIAAGIDAGKFAEVKVINMSLGGPFDQGIANATASAWATDSIVLVAAAGNLQSIYQGGSLVYPAALSNVVGVSGVRTDKSFASTSPCPDQYGGTWKSNSGAHVDLAAPFWALSTVGTNSYQDENQGWCGTSMATPHVSGAGALLFSQNPTWTNQQVVDRLFATAEDRGTSGRDDLFGYGILDAAEAVGVQPPPPPPPISVSIDGPTQIQPSATCTWYAVVGNGTPPYSYQWTASQMAPSYGYDYYFTASKDAGSFATSWPLKVVVTDAVGGTGEHEITVYENPSAMVCPF